MSSQCDKSSLVAYLYGECEPAERQAFEQHLAGCQSCADEVNGLGGVREALGEWKPPEQALGFRIVRDEVAPRKWWRWSPMPAWGLAAAAVLFLAVAAGVANLDVQIGNGALTIRTGWSKTGTQAVASSRQSPANLTPASAPADQSAPWRSDLAAMEQQLRKDFSSLPAQNVPVLSTASSQARGGDEADVLRRVQAMIDQNTQRQQQAFESMLASRMVQLARDFDTQRRTDLQRIQQGIGQVEGRTLSEVAQQREYVRALARTVGIQEMK